MWAIWGSGQEWLAKGFMLLLIGIPVYVWMKWRQSKSREVPIDDEAFSLRRAYTPPPKPPLARSTEKNGRRAPTGVGTD
jgi:hypothetical protein